MRCLALAQAWQDAGGKAGFGIGESPAELLRRLSSEGCGTISITAEPGSANDAEQLVAHALQLEAAWLVVEGDHFKPEYLMRIRQSGFRVLLVDDFGSRSQFPAEMILNPNFGAGEEAYRSSGFRGDLLLGESYVLLRREFISVGDGHESGPGNRVLITLGGSDPTNFASTLLSALRDVRDFQFTLVAGPGYRYRDELEKFRAPNFKILFDADMPGLMREADMAIIVAGGTLWELLHLGCTVLSYTRNPLQASVIGTLASRNIICDMGDIGRFEDSALIAKLEELRKSPSVRETMAQAGRQLIDGKGAKRVIEKLTHFMGR
jgi:UDP-2,4-diacetamido-2,4,6-trideoxy-beta-L-altropyranose hydrolase